MEGTIATEKIWRLKMMDGEYVYIPDKQFCIMEYALVAYLCNYYPEVSSFEKGEEIL